MSVKILFILIIAVIILAGIGYWVYQDNSYSKEILRLEIIGPDKAMVGEEIEYTIRIKNNGDVRLEDPQLIFEFPTASIVSSGQGLRIIVESEQFENFIYPGQEKTFAFNGRIFGKEGDIKEAKAMLSYRPKNLKAGYVSKTSHLLTIEQVPLTFEFDMPSSSGPGQEFNFSLNYFSSVDYPLSDIEIKMSYPAGFSLNEAEPRGLSDTEWRIPLLNKAEGGRIDITGNLSGETGETKIFRAEFGIWEGGEFIVLKNITKQVKLAEPSLYILQTINNVSEYTANPGDLLHYNVVFRNIGTSPLHNLFLAVRLNGALFDFDTIRSTNGQFQQGDNSIIWDSSNISNLQFLDVGEEGQVEFWIKLKDTVARISQPKIESQIILGQTSRKFISKVNTKAEIEQTAYVDDEIFGSEANFPLEKGEKSNFTIIWRVKNYYNPLQDVKVSAILPRQVKLTGEVLPQKLSFDPGTREIVWSVGEMDPMQGVEQHHQLAFQIEFEPTNSQEGKFAQLVGDAVLSAVDNWTGEYVSATSSSITTQTFGQDGKIK